MIDPKRVELKRFSGCRTSTARLRPKSNASWAFCAGLRPKWITATAFWRRSARGTGFYNARAVKAGKPKLPRIVVMIDELADLMLNSAEQT